MLEEENNKVNQCTICLNEIKAKIVFECGHNFCKHCIVNENNILKCSDCPLCRKKLNLDNAWLPVIITEHEIKYNGLMKDFFKVATFIVFYNKGPLCGCLQREAVGPLCGCLQREAVGPLCGCLQREAVGPPCYSSEHCKKICIYKDNTYHVFPYNGETTFPFILCNIPPFISYEDSSFRKCDKLEILSIDKE